MVLMTGLDSIIESLYLKEELTSKQKLGNIIVNPVNTTYLINKTIIINHKYYPSSYIDELIDNRNIIISRFDINDDRVIVDPYELRINDNIQVLGNEIEVVNEDMYENINHVFDGKVLYYPKPKRYFEYYFNGDLTVLGYLIYQLGCDVSSISKSEFLNLDIIKTKCGIIV